MIAFLGCIVWGHHMFMVGFDIDTKAYFTISTSIIAIPTAIKILNWLATIWTGCFFYITPLFFIIGFLFSFSFGGFTGLIIASCILDNLLHDTYFIIGHFHYVLSLGAVYTIFASIYNYINILTCIIYNELLGRLHYTFFFISSNIIFLSMHILGINSFPRRIFDYPILYIRFHWFNNFGMIGIILSLIFFIFSVIINILTKNSLIIIIFYVR
jgi:heme/copper-type cytochrome/quinol oxidase subunit 1